jgi:hypothetical protein
MVTTTVKGPDGREIIARESPAPKPISIAPGQSHDFKVAFERDWTGDLIPGIWTVWIEDDTLKLKSNLVEIPLHFTADSVTACIEIASDKKQHVLKRKEHAKWLQKIIPSVEFHWWSDDTPPQEQQRKQVEIQRQLEAFRKSLRDSNSAQATKAAIDRINREAGKEKKQ